MFGQRKTCKEPNWNTGDTSFYFCTKKKRQTVKIILEAGIRVWRGKGKAENWSVCTKIRSCRINTPVGFCEVIRGDSEGETKCY